MPFRYEESRTPKGSPLLVVHASGHVSLADAEVLGVRTAPGGPNHGWRIITHAAKGIEYAPAARKYFPSMNGNYFALATVVTSPIVRAAINMMMRLTGQATDLKMFSTEAEALAWLDAFERGR
jgi:hypothetical protein